MYRHESLAAQIICLPQFVNATENTQNFGLPGCKFKHCNSSALPLTFDKWTAKNYIKHFKYVIKKKSNY